MIDTVRGRLTLWYVSALALILILFGIAVYVMLSRALHRRVDYALRSTIEISICTLYLNDLLEEVARAGTVLASDRRASVKLTNLPEAVFHGDEDLLRQMLLNLVDNAVKFTPSDGAVTLSLERRKDEYLLSVADAGPGVPAEARHHIFERFYRADRTRTRSEDGGAGLGLAIARWIARAHDGDIELDDSGSTGTKFIIRLPP